MIGPFQNLFQVTVINKPEMLSASKRDTKLLFIKVMKLTVNRHENATIVTNFFRLLACLGWLDWPG